MLPCSPITVNGLQLAEAARSVKLWDEVDWCGSLRIAAVGQRILACALRADNAPRATGLGRQMCPSAFHRCIPPSQRAADLLRRSVAGIDLPSAPRWISKGALPASKMSIYSEFSSSLQKRLRESTFPPGLSRFRGFCLSSPLRTRSPPHRPIRLGLDKEAIPGVHTAIRATIPLDMPAARYKLCNA
jgi:hypothetical protein